ncbi:MAG: alpha/beta hydrolase family protein [Eubacteriales bacterium]|nr:alpha/beta hydrolase family protein [Eubacteriales bacterium]
MPSMHIEMYSDTLRIDTGLEVIYPQNCSRTPAELRDIIKPPYQVLYLLHGIMRDQTGWIRFTNIEQYVMDMGLVVVMPTTYRGHYINQPHGYNYFDYLTKELPAIIGNMFPVSQKKKDTFIAGLSMGGYGALKAAIECPDQYAYAASLSGVVDVETMFKSEDLYSPAERLMTFDNKNPKNGPDDILFRAKEQLGAGVKLPPMFVAIGQQDFMYAENKHFYEELKDRTDIEFLEEEGGHTWDFWDRNIKRALDKMPIKQRLLGHKQEFTV